MEDKIFTFTKTSVEIYHLHTLKINICFRSANDVAGKIIDLNLDLFPKSIGRWSYLKLLTNELDFTDIEAGDYEVSKEISIYASQTPPMSSYDQIMAMIDLHVLTASIDGEYLGSDTIIIEEKLLGIKCSIVPARLVVNSLSEIVFTLQMETTPPLEDIVSIKLAYPPVGHGIDIEHETFETILEAGVLKAKVKMKMQEFPDFFFTDSQSRGSRYIVEVGDTLGYRKPFYGTTTVDINFDLSRNI